ncbi:FAD-binding oxidoreductase [Cupriavidus necator]|uniref:FAD-binding oxidoreductase n=1 Tax=Cupriavidus necator TaxID=106590 RepID=UPI00148F6209|nr:FAD-binding oxidoreductase [Cupriavidus necator]NOV24272.1 FAD-binding oxidoreductase [Cupriavidus necator]
MQAQPHRRGQNGLPLADLEPLRRALHGHLVLDGDPDYEQARRVWNGAVDKYPALVIYCADAHDVGAAIRFARSAAMPLAVRSGGHNVAGLSVCDGGVVIDLSAMKGIDVDAGRRVARAEAGLNLGEFDRATMRHGLATTMGVNSDTGIAGLTLGGGFGKLGRRYGLSCDNLLAAEIVAADGALRIASEQENPDLLWALRGGGGNFGIVTAFHFRLHPIPSHLLTYSVRYRWAHAPEALRQYGVFACGAPDEVCADAALVTDASGERYFSVSACYVGPLETGREALRPLIDSGIPGEATLEPRTYLAMQSSNDSVFPRGRRYYWKAQFLQRIDGEAIAAMLAEYARTPSVSSLLVLQHVGGAIARVPSGATPYVNRDANFDCFPIAIWDDPAEDDKQMEWARAMWQAVRPFSTGGVYANNLGDEGKDRVRAAYGENYARLVEIKRKYDPDNLFRMNQNIDPDDGLAT